MDSVVIVEFVLELILYILKLYCTIRFYDELELPQLELRQLETSDSTCEKEKIQKVSKRYIIETASLFYP